MMCDKTKAATLRMRAKYVTVMHSNTIGVADRWRSQYEKATGWYDYNKKKIYEDLVALGDQPSREAVANIIGNKSWSYLSCDGCNSEAEALVLIGEYEPKKYCKVCLVEANEIAKELP